ncbi:MAG: hypothetical protein IGQ45_02655 [Cyanobacterium sp. T60_A2020_053]|nr:hypothetical protein [Cyanobacterium sp. T60_A2020_053]
MKKEAISSSFDQPKAAAARSLIDKLKKILVQFIERDNVSRVIYYTVGKLLDIRQKKAPLLWEQGVFILKNVSFSN